MTAKFALFDLDDTLVDTATPFHAFCRVFVHEYGLGGDDADAAAAAMAELAERIEAVHGWSSFVEHAEQWYGVTTPPEELLAWIVARYPVNFVLDARVAAGLIELRREGWKLGIVTNGITMMQQAKIDTVGLRRYVDFVIDSEAAGIRKPARRIFEVAAEGLGVELGRHGWMVGDNHANDIVGGHEAGLRTIWLPRRAERPAGSVQADHTCASVLDAMRIIAADKGAE